MVQMVEIIQTSEMAPMLKIIQKPDMAKMLWKSRMATPTTATQLH